MRSAVMLAAAMLALTLGAAEIDPKVLHLIPPDSWMVRGIDVDRYRNSPFVNFYPLGYHGLTVWVGIGAARQIDQLIVAERDENRPFIILRGALSQSQLQSLIGGALESESHSGALILRNEFENAALLDHATAIVGDVESVRDAIDRWNQAEHHDHDLATKVRHVSATYDNWFLVFRPLEREMHPRWPKSLIHRDNLIRTVEEARGGIRLGRSNELRLDVVTKTPDDAVALAALGRWLPGLIQWERPYIQESLLANLIENLEARASGRVFSLSFSISARKLEALIEEERVEAEKRGER